MDIGIKQFDVNKTAAWINDHFGHNIGNNFKGMYVMFYILSVYTRREIINVILDRFKISINRFV